MSAGNVNVPPDGRFRAMRLPYGATPGDPPFLRGLRGGSDHVALSNSAGTEGTLRLRGESTVYRYRLLSPSGHATGLRTPAEGDYDTTTLSVGDDTLISGVCGQVHWKFVGKVTTNNGRQLWLSSANGAYCLELVAIPAPQPIEGAEQEKESEEDNLGNGGNRGTRAATPDTSSPPKRSARSAAGSRGGANRTASSGRTGRRSSGSV